MPTRDPYRVPERLRNRYEQMVERTDPLAAGHLNGEYADYARRMAAALARKRPSPLESGRPRTWAAGILYAVGWVNFLSDPKQDPHMTTAELADWAGVGQSTIAAQFGKIRDALGLRRLSLEWTLPGRLADNPLVWILKVNGHLVDIRTMPRDAQEAAFDAGLIPFIPADDAPPGPEARSKGAEAKPRATAAEGQRTRRSSDPERVYQLKITLEDVRPAIWRRVLVPEDTTLVGLHRVIQAAMGWEDYHLWRFELGDVEYAEPSDEEWRPTEDARQARLGQVAGRCCVLRYVYDYGDDNEENVWLLHVVRLLLELAGLVKRRNGLFSLTRTGEKLATPARAGELCATLFRVHFRRFNLGYLDRGPDVSEFQFSISYSLFRFGSVGGEWMNRYDLVESIVLPGWATASPRTPCTIRFPGSWRHGSCGRWRDSGWRRNRRSSVRRASWGREVNSARRRSTTGS